MKVLLPCIECIQKDKSTEHILYMEVILSFIECIQKDKSTEHFYFSELQDNGLYKLTCKNDHISYTCLKELKFQILYELGAYAIIDGYYREAVVSFTAALERFFEFYIEIISMKHKISSKIYNSTWSSISSQSERQLGAAFDLFCLLAHSGDLSTLLRLR